MYPIIRYLGIWVIVIVVVVLVLGKYLDPIRVSGYKYHKGQGPMSSDRAIRSA